MTTIMAREERGQNTLTQHHPTTPPPKQGKPKQTKPQTTPIRPDSRPLEYSPSQTTPRLRTDSPRVHKIRGTTANNPHRRRSPTPTTSSNTCPYPGPAPEKALPSPGNKKKPFFEKFPNLQGWGARQGKARQWQGEQARANFLRPSTRAHWPHPTHPRGPPAAELEFFVLRTPAPIPHPGYRTWRLVSVC
ncbi:hypothetical protein BS50DRAFT_590328 [Corynespora cassiicola Philippines]|uniref:Uncharacterized protein n=1 Tax=Corynespora cassiicola Philippines TaxID=1448308 RepID=A0A2T2NGF5_CORCC|nr:hypothetical protein BS50DRAFT_590328 [Corynespora cassiicola Philippines]